MNDTVLDPIHGSSGGLDLNGDTNKPEFENPGLVEVNSNNSNSNDVVVCSKGVKNGRNSSNDVFVKRERPTRACTTRAPKYVDPPVIERRPRAPKKEKAVAVVEEEDVNVSEEENEGMGQCSKVVTSLVNQPTPDQMPRWQLRSMWELASILHFLHVFRPLLNITVEFSAEELESALLTPNGTLGDVHIPLLKAIPPVIRSACGRDTWVTVLCRKLRDWWHWVAEGDLPIVSAQGAEIETYKNLDPAVRVVILKALCDIRVEQDDIRSYIDNSVKHGVQLSAFRKARIGGDSHGISYWYEDDELIGHRLYRESRKVEKNIEVKKGKTKGSHVLPSTSYEWETVATNLDEFLDVSEKLFSSTSRTEVALGKKLKNDMIPEIERIHKKKEKWLKKQHRQALLLDNFVNMDGFGAGRSLRDRKPVTYTFDDFDRSINEAIKVTKRKQHSPEPGIRRELTKPEPSANGRWNGSSHSSMHESFSALSPDFDEMDEDHKSEPLDRSSRRRQKSQRYSVEEFVGALSDDEYVASDDDIVGEAVYYDDEEELEDRKQKKKVTSSSEGEGEEEYDWSDENGDDELEEEEDSMSVSEDSDQPRKRSKETQGRARRQTRLRSADDDPGLRRSKRSTRNQIDYQKYEFSESETESIKQSKTNLVEYSMGSQDSDEGEEEEDQERGFDESIPMAVEKDENQPSIKSESPSQDEDDRVGERRFLDLNELAPGPGLEDGPSALVKDNDGKDE
ncbi:DDT domain-containing protein DDR4-like [Silene latifolia]|uniref:DDT domain-containing protein DDR4-like n=1 Tax=Silene latifolia TaxID=37657 RepID=UPI003D782C8A